MRAGRLRSRAGRFFELGCKQRSATADQHLATARIGHIQLPPAVGVQGQSRPSVANHHGWGVVHDSPHSGSDNIRRNPPPQCRPPRRRAARPARDVHVSPRRWNRLPICSVKARRRPGGCAPRPRWPGGPRARRSRSARGRRTGTPRDVPCRANTEPSARDHCQSCACLSGIGDEESHEVGGAGRSSQPASRSVGHAKLADLGGHPTGINRARVYDVRADAPATGSTARSHTIRSSARNGRTEELAVVPPLRACGADRLR